MKYATNLFDIEFNSEDEDEDPDFLPFETLDSQQQKQQQSKQQQSHKGSNLKQAKANDSEDETAATATVPNGDEIARRTRAKNPLTSMSIEELEAALCEPLELMDDELQMDFESQQPLQNEEEEDELSPLAPVHKTRSNAKNYAELVSRVAAAASANGNTTKPAKRLTAKQKKQLQQQRQQKQRQREAEDHSSSESTDTLVSSNDETTSTDDSSSDSDDESQQTQDASNTNATQQQSQHDNASHQTSLLTIPENSARVARRIRKLSQQAARLQEREAQGRSLRMTKREMILREQHASEILAHAHQMQLQHQQQLLEQQLRVPEMTLRSQPSMLTTNDSASQQQQQQPPPVADGASQLAALSHVVAAAHAAATAAATTVNPGTAASHLAMHAILPPQPQTWQQQQQQQQQHHAQQQQMQQLHQLQCMPMQHHPMPQLSAFTQLSSNNSDNNLSGFPTHLAMPQLAPVYVGSAPQLNPAVATTPFLIAPLLASPGSNWSSAQLQQLQSQLRRHVQLLLQTHVITTIFPSQDEAKDQRRYQSLCHLNTLLEECTQRFVAAAPNTLFNSLALVAARAELTHNITPELATLQRQQQQHHHKKRTTKFIRPLFHRSQADHVDVIDQWFNHPVLSLQLLDLSLRPLVRYLDRSTWSRSEDALLVLALQTYGYHETEDGKKKHPRWDEIQERFLLAKTVNEIKTRFVNVRQRCKTGEITHPLTRFFSHTNKMQKLTQDRLRTAAASGVELTSTQGAHIESLLFEYHKGKHKKWQRIHKQHFPEWIGGADGLECAYVAWRHKNRSKNNTDRSSSGAALREQSHHFSGDASVIEARPQTESPSQPEHELELEHQGNFSPQQLDAQHITQPSAHTSAHHAHHTQWAPLNAQQQHQQQRGEDDHAPQSHQLQHTAAHRPFLHPSVHPSVHPHSAHSTHSAHQSANALQPLHQQRTHRTPPLPYAHTPHVHSHESHLGHSQHRHQQHPVVDERPAKRLCHSNSSESARTPHDSAPNQDSNDKSFSQDELLRFAAAKIREIEANQAAAQQQQQQQEQHHLHQQQQELPHESQSGHQQLRMPLQDSPLSLPRNSLQMPNVHQMPQRHFPLPPPSSRSARVNSVAHPKQPHLPALPLAQMTPHQQQIMQYAQPHEVPTLHRQPDDSPYPRVTPLDLSSLGAHPQSMLQLESQASPALSMQHSLLTSDEMMALFANSPCQSVMQPLSHSHARSLSQH